MEKKKTKKRKTRKHFYTGEDKQHTLTVEERKELARKFRKPKTMGESVMRNWLIKHGKKQYIDFDEEQTADLRKYFNSLDDDGSESITVDELEIPLIALGLADTREQVVKIIDSVDDDGSGEIEFDEFLSIVKNSNVSTADKAKGEVESENFAKIHQFFKDLTQGKLKKKDDVPFSLYISTARRQAILDSLMLRDSPENESKKKQADKVLKNFTRQVAAKKLRLYKKEESMDPTDVDNQSFSVGHMPDPETVLFSILKNKDQQINWNP